MPARSAGRTTQTCSPVSVDAPITSSSAPGAPTTASLVPLSSQPSAVGVAVTPSIIAAVAPSASRRSASRAGSVEATRLSTAPASAVGSHGPGSSRRPVVSAITANSARPAPSPPCCSGRCKPDSPCSTQTGHQSGLAPQPHASRRCRVRDIGAWRAARPATSSASSRCSGPEITVVMQTIAPESHSWSRPRRRSRSGPWCHRCVRVARRPRPAAGFRWRRPGVPTRWRRRRC